MVLYFTLTLIIKCLTRLKTGQDVISKSLQPAAPNTTDLVAAQPTVQSTNEFVSVTKSLCSLLLMQLLCLV